VNIAVEFGNVVAARPRWQAANQQEHSQNLCGGKDPASGMTSEFHLA